MAEIRLMGRLERIWLVQTPSPTMHAWRDVLGQACRERGWDFAVHERGDPTPTAAADRPLLVVAWMDQSGDLDVTHWAVQLSPPFGVTNLLQSQGDLSEHDALYEASMRLATAWGLRERGAQVCWFDEPAIELPGLGRIEALPSLAIPSPDWAMASPPLAMFDRGAAMEPRVVSWGQEMFLYPDRRPSEITDGYLSLVGRRRLLLNGPNIFLPPGYWRFSAELSIQPPGRTELLVEWGYGHDVVSLTTPIGLAGRYEFSLEKQWTDVQPADFRISLMIPALEGEFVFHGGVLSRR